jgi:hypothetical protein
MIVYSYEGGGINGHLVIIMTNDEYFAVATDVFGTSSSPGGMVTILVGMMAVQISESNRAHVEATRVYHIYHNIDQAFNKLIIDAFKDLCLNALSDEVVGYTNCTSLKFITHILMYYSMIAPAELTQNYEWLNMLYDPNQPIETLSVSKSKILELLRYLEDKLTAIQ